MSGHAGKVLLVAIQAADIRSDVEYRRDLHGHGLHDNGFPAGEWNRTLFSIEGDAVKIGARIPFCEQSPRRIASPRSGFTLVELLVVIAVIIIIAALLLPALSHAKARAQQVDCMSRKKQWSMAFQMYADDNENFIAREGYERLGGVKLNNWGQVRGIIGPPGVSDSDDVWYNALPLYVGVPKASAYALPNKHAEFYERSTLFHCAAAKFPPQVANPQYAPKYFFALFSIAMNSQL